MGAIFIPRVAIVTDSTADLPPALVEQWGVTVIPLTINFAVQQYRDGVDLTSEEFYPLLQAAESLPTSSQPSPAEFQRVYERLLKDHDSIISIHLSSGLSGTLQSAAAARDAVDGDVRLFDSRSISLGIGCMVADAVELVRQGRTPNEIIRQLELARDKTEVLFTLDTLECLHKGGRIGKVTAVLGTLMNIKPIIRVVNGVYVPAGKARRLSQALPELVRIFQSISAGRRIRRIAVAHGAAQDAAERLASLLTEAYRLEPYLLTQVSPVIGVHTGPGTIGAAIQME